MNRLSLSLFIITIYAVMFGCEMYGMDSMDSMNVGTNTGSLKNSEMRRRRGKSCLGSQSDMHARLDATVLVLTSPDQRDYSCVPKKCLIGYSAECMNGQDSEKLTTLLIKSVNTGNVSRALKALKNGANQNVVTGNQESILTYAAGNGDFVLVSLLLWYNAEVNPVPKSNKIPLIEAVLRSCHKRLGSVQDYMNVIWALVVAGADVCATTKGGHTVLQLATPAMREVVESAQVVRSFLECVADDD